MTTRRSYTDEQKQAALDAYAEHGPAEASRQTGVPTKTIASWAARSGVQMDAGARSSAVEAAKITWEIRRKTLADDFGRAAAELIEHARIAARTSDRPRDAQALMTAAAIGVDKAQLLAGGATARVEHDVTDPQARLAAVHELKEAAARRASGQATEETA